MDFLTPLVNDPYEFGRIAAANSLSDVYAMGGEPWAAMNIVCFPQGKMPPWVLQEILRGGRDQVLAAGAAPAGGHSVSDDELKYGLAVSGAVDPERVAIKGGLKPGDFLVLTKPIGTGVLATAVKAQWQGWQEFEALIIRWAARLNAGGARVLRELGLRGPGSHAHAARRERGLPHVEELLAVQPALDVIFLYANADVVPLPGLDGAIHRAAGPGLLDEGRTLGGCPTGQARLTTAYNLPCHWVIHTVGPVWHGGGQGEDDLLASCYRASLELAQTHGAVTVAFPAISTGAYGFPPQRAARIAVTTVSGWLAQRPRTVQAVQLVAFDAAALACLRQAINGTPQSE